MGHFFSNTFAARHSGGPWWLLPLYNDTRLVLHEKTCQINDLATQTRQCRFRTGKNMSQINDLQVKKQKMSHSWISWDR
jgi:hypothetical protein